MGVQLSSITIPAGIQSHFVDSGLRQGEGQTAKPPQKKSYQLTGRAIAGDRFRSERLPSNQPYIPAQAGSHGLSAERIIPNAGPCDCHAATAALRREEGRSAR